ncbi:MAG: SpoIID/LytB domain-containing protein [Actinomycetes bacterium]
MDRTSWIKRGLSLLTVPALVLAVLTLPATAQAATVPSSISFSGSGWGHGVGLSQVGARGQATEGRTATQILTHYFTGTVVRTVADNVDLRVNLAFNVSSVKLRGEALGATGGNVEITVGSKVVKAASKSVVTLRTSGNSVQVLVGGVAKATGNPVVVRWSGTSNPGSTGTGAAVLNLVDPTKNIDSNGHRYRYGRVEVRSRTNSAGVRTLSAVNVLKLHDEYLLGLGEMPSSWPMAALQAQVIAARNYAMVRYNSGVRAGCWCHVFNNTSDQVFVGYGKEAGASGARWHQAVVSTNKSATTSSMLLYRGAVAQTFFFDCSGGRTQNSEDVWGSAEPYLRSVDDHWSLDSKYNPTFASWGPKVRTQAQVATAFGLADVVGLSYATRYTSGAARTVTATSSKGVSASLPGSTFTARLGLTSRWSFVTGTANPFVPKPVTPPVTPPVATPPATTPAPPAAATSTDPYTQAVNANKSVPLTSRTIVVTTVPTATAVNQLVAAPLVASLRAPLLYTSTNGMPRVTAAEVHRRAPTTAYIIGGTSIVSATVEAQLRNAGVHAIIRISGTDRFAMSVAIASAMNVPIGRSVFVVNGTDHARLAALAPLAARSARPILLVRSTSIPAPVATYLKAHKPRTTTVVGPTTMVSNSVLHAVPAGVRSAR